MQSAEMVEKKICYWDAVEIPGLVNVAEIAREKRTVEVPSFRKIRDVQSGVEKLPQVTLIYKLERDTVTLEFFDNFFDNNEIKDLEIVRTDAHGVEFKRTIYSDCEMISMTEPAYDAASPDYAKVTIIVAPGNITKI